MKYLPVLQKAAEGKNHAWKNVPVRRAGDHDNQRRLQNPIDTIRGANSAVYISKKRRQTERQLR